MAHRNDDMGYSDASLWYSPTSGRTASLPDDREAQTTSRAAKREVDGGFLLGIGFACLFFLAAFVEISSSGPGNLVLFMMLGAAAVWSAFSEPRWYLALLAAYFPFSMAYPFVVGLGINMTNLLLALGLVALASKRARTRRRYRMGAFEGLLIAFCVLGFLGFLRAYGATSGLGLAFHLTAFKRWVSPIVFFFLFRALLQDRRDVSRLLKVMALTTTFAAALTWWSAIERGSRSSIEASRVSGIFNGPNEMGTFLVYAAMPLLAVAVWPTGFRKRLAYLAGFLLCARAMLFTFSRGAYVSLAVGAATVLLFRGPAHFGVGVLGGGIIALIEPSVIPASVRDRLAETSEEPALGRPGAEHLDRSVSHRFVLWGAAAGIIRAHPVFGVGLGRFPYYVDAYAPQKLRPNDPRDVHNAYLLIATELGVPALLVFIAAIATLVVTCLRLYVRRRGRFDRMVAVSALGATAALVCTFMLGSRLADENFIGYFWTFAAMVMALRHMPQLEVGTSSIPPHERAA